MFFPYKDDNPRVLVPYVNYVIIGLNIIVFTGQTMLSLPDPRIGVALINVFGFIPGQFIGHINIYVYAWWFIPYNG